MSKSTFDPRKLMDIPNPESGFPINKGQRVLGSMTPSNAMRQQQPIQPIAPPPMESSFQEKKPSKVLFSVALLVADKPTSNGNIYPRALCHKLIERFTFKPQIIIQELNPIERQLKKISLAEPWDKKIMAVVKSATMVEDNLVITAECRMTRDGKKLAGMLQTLGINAIEFMPVGYGIPDSQNRIGLDYRLNYIAVTPKEKK